MKHPFRTAALSAAVIATLGLSSAAVAGGRPDLVLAGLKAGKAHQAGELLVKFRDGSTAAQQTAIRQGLGAEKLETVRGGSANERANLPLRLPAGRTWLPRCVRWREPGNRLCRTELDLPAQRDVQRHLLHQRFAVGHVRGRLFAGQPVRLAGRQRGALATPTVATSSSA
jgi:hypothetical protein